MGSERFMNTQHPHTLSHSYEELEVAAAGGTTCNQRSGCNASPATGYSHAWPRAASRRGFGLVVKNSLPGYGPAYQERFQRVVNHSIS